MIALQCPMVMEYTTSWGLQSCRGCGWDSNRSVAEGDATLLLRSLQKEELFPAEQQSGEEDRRLRKGRDSAKGGSEPSFNTSALKV